ncbi:unnamed protein product [Prorocentrum cordatum]|uniref:Uncharacterized protein n=1 Tax=Prorocentrum cordatum TaxID=2364126 RepID=A0ABN9UIK7_9DINO|nr:unnamed protein product [Polarella glacialis]
MKAARVAGRTHHEQAQLKKTEGEEASADLGPPFVHVWAALVHGMGTDPKCPPRAREIFEQCWQEKICARELQQVAEEIRACRVRPTRKGEGKPDKVRVTLSVDRGHDGLERAVIQYMQAVGAVRKIGPAPRGALERDAAKFLAKLEGK